ncbi:hypothetical protein FG135_18980 [Vibrio cholerae]|uniref:hypothetical protein n=1 Tax=Vibrio cholerae TaxID=666 RepID=UPI00085218DB|nr:hypothetical protein [Vibrio cholerae]EIC9845550.1 hypothetical protein [Vibrio cholerae]EJL6300387.1 hypothetical protein [Vibrio cholerae]EJL6329256.1 hypothetical protein [Vibrio cholerae]EJL6478256.1 hypothetical protein [Vibrio cholerae]EJL6773907.1 hypothetical protein [Vibrio cholerae]
MKIDKMEIASIISKGALGAIPLVGPLAAEVVGAIIPNQRIERIETLLHDLESRVKHAKIDGLDSKFLQPKFIDLLEDGFVQASRAFNSERIEYIASLLKNSLSDEQIKYEEYKKLLVILNDLNDIEILHLKSYSLDRDDEEYDEFWHLHDETLTPPLTYMDSSEEDFDKQAIFETYRSRLVALGLIKIRYKKPRKGELPEFDEKTGMIKANGHSITRLGSLLLRSLDLSAS